MIAPNSAGLHHLVIATTSQSQHGVRCSNDMSEIRWQSIICSRWQTKSSINRIQDWYQKLQKCGHSLEYPQLPARLSLNESVESSEIDQAMGNIWGPMLAWIESLRFPQRELHSDHVSWCSMLWEWCRDDGDLRFRVVKCREGKDISRRHLINGSLE